MNKCFLCISIIYQTKDNDTLHILNDLDVLKCLKYMNNDTFKFYLKGDDNFS